MRKRYRGLLIHDCELFPKVCLQLYQRAGLELQLARHNSEQEFTLKIVSVMEPLIEYFKHC